MRLAEYTDYALRVLMYCANRPHQLVTISELADYHGVSRNHLMKIVTDLGRQGVLETTRGRGGGLRLLKDPAELRIGDVVRASETDFRLVECFDSRTNRCTLDATCRLKGVFSGALRAYFEELDAFTVADLIEPVPGTAANTVVTATAPRTLAQRRRTSVATVAPPERPRRAAQAGKTDA